MSEISRYFSYLSDVLAEAGQSQEDNIKKAAQVIADGYANGKQFYSFGTGHSHMIAEELYMRAGGLVFARGILPGEMMLHDFPHKSTLLERLPGYADALLQLYNLQAGDTLIVISNSGTNSVPLEMAMGAKERGVYVIAITSLKHSKKVTARHESGKKLFEVADLVIDNQTEYGDASFLVPGCDITTGPISDFIGIALVQALVVAITEALVAKGIDPPILCSSNVDDGAKRNAKYLDGFRENFK